MDQLIEKRFIFHANAVAFAAHIRRPEDHQFLAVASSCLPVSGGLAEASSGPQNYQEFISFQSAYSNARGDFADIRRAADFTSGNHGMNDLPTNTFVEAKLSGLKVVNREDRTDRPRTLVVEEMHARLESSSDRRNPVAFRSMDSTINGVSVDGRKLTIHTAPEVCSQNETYEKLVQTYEEDGKFRKQYGSLFFPTGLEKKGVGALLSRASIPNADGLIYGTVVTGMEWDGAAPDNCHIHGNKLTVDGIGSIYFGEILIDRNSRRLTLIRLQLGSYYGSSGAGCDIQSNGSTWPPQLQGL